MTLAVMLLAFCVVVIEWPLLSEGRIPDAQDAVIYFYPLSSLTGRLLSLGALPVWNIHQMSGMPLMGDPQGGWGSLTTMLSYMLLPLQGATLFTLVTQMLLGAVGTLLFLRSTGITVSGATLGAVAYGIGGTAFTAQSNLSGVGVRAWLPWLLFGADYAIRHSGRRRLVGWSVAAFAASQELSVWLGQGAYYAFLATAAYVAFLTLLGEPSEGRGMAARLRELLLHSAALSALSLLLSAWSLFPRLEFLFESNLRGGYGATEQQFVGGRQAGFWVSHLIAGGPYIGAVVAFLIAAALVPRPTRTQLYYVGMVALTYVASLKWMIDAAQDSPAMRRLFGLVPGLLSLHLHNPERINFLYLFFGAALAAVTLDRVLQVTGVRRLWILGTAIVLLLGLWAVSGPAWGAPRYNTFFLAFASILIVLGLTWSGRLPVRVASLTLVAVAAVELLYSGSVAAERSMSLGNPRAYYTHPTTQRTADLVESLRPRGRFFGYHPQVIASSDTGYRDIWGSRDARGLLLTTQATEYGLEDMQGYNPLHLAVYDRLLAVANGKQQHYRSAYVMPRALDSPLLDMLNARWVLAKGGVRLGSKYERVQYGSGPWLYENTHALPRVWVVHDALIHDDDEALRSIDRGEVDPRRMAVVSEPITGLRPRTSAEQVALEEHGQSRIVAKVTLSSPGLVVLGELDYPAWKVQVDGKPARSLRANGAIRAVQVPAGSHTIIWHYSSTPTTLGFVLSALTALALIAAFALWPRLTTRRRPTH